jgi:hypothetical protein
LEYIACTVAIRNTYKFLVGNPEGKRLHGRLGCRWEDNIKVYIKEIIYECGLDL